MNRFPFPLLILLLSLSLLFSCASRKPKPATAESKAKFTALTLGRPGAARGIVEPTSVFLTRDPQIVALAEVEELKAEIFARRFVSGSWQAAVMISTVPPGLPFVPSYTKPEVAADPSGNAFVSWTTESCPSSEVWGNRFAAAGGWGEAALIRNTICNFAVNVATTRDGEAFSIFWSSGILGEGVIDILYSARNF